MYEEVLNNHITNESDVIKVAIEQYQEKQMKTRAIDAKPDDYLSITQVVDENGSEQDIISTGLLIVDEHQQRVAITDIVSNTGQLSQYSIYATMKVSVTNDRQALKVRINWFETTLNYGTSMKASSLMQTSKYSPEVGFQYDAISYFQKTWQKSEDVKNGSIVPIKGGSGFQIMTAVVNDKTGQVEHLLLWFK